MSTQFSDSNSPVSVLHGTNRYSLISSVYFHWSSLSVFWQRIYNTFTVAKSSNHVLGLRRSTSTTNFPWLSLTIICLWLCWEPCNVAVVQARIEGNTPRYRYCCLTSSRITEAHVTWSLHTVVWRRLRMPCVATVHARTQGKHFHSIGAGRMRQMMPTGLPPRNALSKSVTIYTSSSNWYIRRNIVTICFCYISVIHLCQ
jgi:hypothetical protein